MKVYITKYALSTGIIETDDAEICSNIISGDMISSKKYGTFHGNDWHKKKEDAVLRAEVMRIKKIESLKKQIEKLDKTKFSL